MKEQRKISARLTVQLQGLEYDLSHIPGIMIGELADIESTEQGVFVGFPAGTPLRHLVQAKTLNEFGFSTIAIIFGQQPTVSGNKEPSSAATDTQRQGNIFKLGQEDCEAIAGEIIKHFGGQPTAFEPMQIKAALDHRDELLFAEFNDYNHAELSKKYNLSVRGVYQALARCRKRQDAVVQHPGGRVVEPGAATSADQQDDTDWYCEQVFARFNGKNHAELAEELGGSLQDVYKAILHYRRKQDAVVQHLVSAIAKGKALHLDAARDMLNAAEPKLYQHTLEQLNHKLALLDLCNSLGGSKRHD